MDRDASYRRHVLDLLGSGGAHVAFDKVVEGLAPELRGRRPEGAAHSPWEVLEHLRIAQWDILEYSRNADHVSPKWPAGYWPQGPEPPDDGAWGRSVAAFRADLAAMKALVADPEADLLAPLPWAAAATLLGEALLVADHNAYHLGELVVVRRLLGAWE
jgi:DinB superfamily